MVLREHRHRAGLIAQEQGALAELVLRSEFRNLRNAMTDKPTQACVFVGDGRRSALNYSGEPVVEDQREFIRQVIALLESHRRAGDFDRLAIFAEHDMLGQLRKMMPKATRDMVVREVAKNLLPLSAPDLLEEIVRELNHDPVLY